MSGIGGHLRCLVVACAATLLFLAAPGPSVADTFDDPGFATETIATVPPFTLVGLAFAPDGRLFVWQKNGVVRIIKNGVMLPTPFVNLSSGREGRANQNTLQGAMTHDNSSLLCCYLK